MLDVSGNRLIHILLLVFWMGGNGNLLAQEEPSNEILERKLLVLTSLKHPDKRFALDSTGLINIVCVNSSDSLISTQYRQLSGKLIYFTDSSLVLHVEEETISTYRRDGTSGQFFYSIEQDSTRLHIDTLQFSEIQSLRFDKGRFRLMISFLQSTTYTFAAGNMLILIAALVLPNKYPNLVSGTSSLIVTSCALAAGGSSFLFYPKLYKLQQQPKKRKFRIHWKLEVI